MEHYKIHLEVYPFTKSERLGFVNTKDILVLDVKYKNCFNMRRAFEMAHLVLLHDSTRDGKDTYLIIKSRYTRNNIWVGELSAKSLIGLVENKLRSQKKLHKDAINARYGEVTRQVGDGKFYNHQKFTELFGRR